ncbi:hypothetical protein Sste5346_003715 [Sporothrix stenoceras]|uniref:Uncharacterized protein n=1 Tax=Sporothrix stenoceras TaxID=5173 RepID=A0ABR3ZB07_9PEZI
MGGSAFASGGNPLYTPRMPPAVYTAVRDHCHAVLFSLFVVVASPIEGPEKPNFGDIDILMALPHDDSPDKVGPYGATILREAMRRLGAVRAQSFKGKASFAIPWPADQLARAPVPPEDIGEDSKPPHIQVDLSLSPSLDLLHWALFKHAHGDFWNIVGSSILRPLGLVVDEQALWIRVPEIENKDRKRSRIMLSEEPAVVLHFLGLSEDDDANSVWDQPFPSVQAMFDCVTNSRFFYLADLRSEAHNIGKNTDPNLARLALVDKVNDLSHLKSNDRRRLRKRPLFAQWTEYMQTTLYGNYEHLPTKMYSDAVPTRESVRDAVFEQFPGVEAKYKVVSQSYLRETHLLAVRTAAKNAVPPFLPLSHRGGVVAAVRQALGIKKVRDGGNDDEAADAAMRWTVEGVTEHVHDNWLELVEETSPETYKKYVEDERSAASNSSMSELPSTLSSTLSSTLPSEQQSTADPEPEPEPNRPTSG